MSTDLANVMDVEKGQFTDSGDMRLEGEGIVKVVARRGWPI